MSVLNKHLPGRGTIRFPYLCDTREDALKLAHEMGRPIVCKLPCGEGDYTIENIFPSGKSQELAASPGIQAAVKRFIEASSPSPQS